MTFQTASSVKPISSQVKAITSNIDKVAKKGPNKVTLTLSTIQKKKSDHNEPTETSGGSDDEEYESPAPVMSSRFV